MAGHKIQNISLRNHLAAIWVLGVLGGGGLPMDWYAACLCGFSPWAAQKSKLLKLGFFFDIVTTHNDHPSYVKYDLGSIYVFFTLFGYPVGIAQGGFSARWTCRRQ